MALWPDGLRRHFCIPLAALFLTEINKISPVCSLCESHLLFLFPNSLLRLDISCPRPRHPQFHCELGCVSPGCASLLPGPLPNLTASHRELPHPCSASCQDPPAGVGFASYPAPPLMHLGQYRGTCPRPGSLEGGTPARAQPGYCGVKQQKKLLLSQCINNSLKCINNCSVTGQGPCRAPSPSA